MSIIQNIPRKQGSIFVPPSTPLPVRASIFGGTGAAGARVNNNNGVPDSTVASGTRNVVASTGGDANPVGGMQNTATQRYVKQMSSSGPVKIVPQTDLNEVGTHEHGSFFSPQIQKEATVRVQGGVDKNSNTPFHPSTSPVTRPRRYPANAGERTRAESFTSNRTLSAKSNHDQIGSRWNVIKRGAADGYVEMVTDDNGFVVPAGQPQSGVAAGSGTTGNSTTATPENVAAPVVDNAHSGSPNIVPWVPNIRRGQPNERGTTFPVQQNRCMKGCK